MAQDNDQNIDVEQQKRSIFGSGVKRAIFGALCIGAIIGGIAVLGFGAWGAIGGIALFGVAAAFLVGAIKSRTNENTGLIDYAARQRAQYAGQSLQQGHQKQPEVALDAATSPVQPEQAPPAASPSAPQVPPLSTTSSSPSTKLMEASAPSPVSTKQSSLGA